MKTKMLVKVACLMFAVGLPLAWAADLERGKELFESPTLGGGTKGRSCSTCHPGGSGLGKDTLPEMVNACIEKALGGTAIDPDGADMADLIAYMKSLVTK